MTDDRWLTVEEITKYLGVSANKRLELFRHGYSETLVSLKTKPDDT